MGCRIAANDRTSYPVGTIITDDAEKRKLVLSSDTVKVTYEACVPSGEYGPVHLYIKEDGEWRRCLAAQYGCWAFFAKPIDVIATKIEVTENNDDVVEVAIKWVDFALNVPYLSGNGIVYRDFAGSLVYPQSSASYRYITSIKELTLLVRVEKKHQGVFLGWHSIPRIGPEQYWLKTAPTAANEESSQGERELGTGSGSNVVWSSGGHLSRHPTWGQKSEWTTAEATLGAISNHAAWCLIDDPTYASFNHAAYIPTQTAGYPKYQSTGPWWVCDISSSLQVVRVMALRKPTEAGVWQYSPYSTEGTLVAHFCNEWPQPNGTPYPFQVFIGAKRHVPDSTNSYANEPSAAAYQKAGEIINALVWPGEKHEPGAWN